MTWLRAFSLALLGLALAASLKAEPALPPAAQHEIAVTARLREALPAQDSLRITGVATWFGAGKVEPVRFDLALTEARSLRLPAGRWVLQAEAPGYWGSTFQLDLTAAVAEPISLDLWPAGEIHGGFTLPQGEAPPTELMCFFRPSKGAVQAGLLPAPDRVICPVTGRKWSCALPAGLMDLRVQAPGFVPRYLWAATIERGKTLRPGAFELYRGSAVLGWVVTADGTPLGDVATVELRPRAGGTVHNTEERERLASLVFRAKVSRQGFFQLDGVAPGAYVIEVRHERFAPALASVKVAPNEVTELANPPLVLELPKQVDVFVDPPLDPAGQPWTVQLHRLDRASFVLAAATSLRPAGTDGVWKLPGAAPGNYYLRIGRQGGDVWWADQVEVTPDLGPIEVRLDVIKVEGSVRLGKNPLPAHLYIGQVGGRHAAVRVEVDTDESGEFEAFVPRPGEWTVHVSAKAPPVEREIPKVVIEPKPGTNEAEVELRLPNTTLAGKVVDPKGKPVPRAIVSAESIGSKRESQVQVWADDEGKFSFSGLLAGPTLVGADGGRELYAYPVLVEVVDDRVPEPLVLVAGPQLRLSGVVGSAAGPVSGARVTASPVGIRHLGVGSVTTDSQGRFEVFLPPETREADFRVEALGFAFRMLRIAIPSSRMVPLLVDQQAGTLVIETTEPIDYTDPERRGVYVVRGGAIEGLGALTRWAISSGSAPSEPTRAVVPSVEPGDYQVCWATAAELPALALGVAPKGPCTSGQLAANGELTLKLGTPRK